MSDKSIFVKNRLLKICQLCETFPVKFGFCAGTENPAVYASRPCSYKQLIQGNYHTEPDISQLLSNQRDIPAITIPNPFIEHSNRRDQSFAVNSCSSAWAVTVARLVDPTTCSSFSKLLSVYTCVHKFVNLLKARLK